MIGVMSKVKHILLVILSSLLFCGEITANSIKLVKNFKALSIGNKVEYLEDYSFSLNIDSVINPHHNKQFKASTSEYLRFNITNASIWIRLTVDASSADPNKKVLLQLSHAILDSVQFFVPTAVPGKFKQLSAGLQVPYLQRSVQSRLPCFELPVAQNTQTYYLCIKSKIDKNFLIQVYEEPLMQQSEQRFLIIFTIVEVVLLLCALVGFFHFLIYRYWLSLIFVGQNILQGIIMLIYYGFISQLFPSEVQFQETLLKVIFPLTGIFEVLFAVSYLQLSRSHPRYYKFFMAIGGLLTILLLVSPFLPKILTIATSITLINIAWIIIVVLAFKGFKEPKKARLFSRLGIAVFCLFGAIFGAVNFAGLPIYKIVASEYLFPMPALLLRSLFFLFGVYFSVKELFKAKESADNQVELFQKEIDVLRERIAQMLEIADDDQTSSDVVSPDLEILSQGVIHNMNPWAILNAKLLSPLTNRELEVLSAIATGKTNKQIAEELFVSPNTIKTHSIRIYEKLGVNNRTEAVSKANHLNQKK